jgi:ATP-binding cassette subfamily B protein
MIFDFPFYKQLDYKDCGPACLKMISEYYGRKYSISRLRNLSYISKQGVSLMGISDAAESIGYRAFGVRLPIESLVKDAPLPCILHWNQNHFVVCYKITHKKNGDVFHIADPAFGRLKLSLEDLRMSWISSKRDNIEKGIVLLLEPTSSFYQNEDDKTSTIKSLSSFFSYLKPYRKQLVQIVTASIIFMLVGLLMPFLSQSIVDVGIQNSDLGFIKLIMLFQLVLAFSNLLVGFLQSWISIHTNTRIYLSMIIDFWSKLFRLPISFFETRSMGDIMRRLNDHDRIQGFMLGDALNIAFAVVNLVIYSTILCIYDISVFSIFIFGQLLYVAWTCFFMRFRKKLDYQGFKYSGKNQNLVIQMLEGVQDIKMNNCEYKKLWEWEQIQLKLFNNNIYGLRLGQIQSIGAVTIIQTMNIIISYIVAKNVVDHTMTLGMMLSISYVMGQLSGPFGQFISFAHSLQDAKISIERLDEIHNSENERENDENDRKIIPDDDIHFNDVSFSYSGSPRQMILKKINLTIQKGKTTAIVGLSGSGKTTIMKLLQGTYTPTEGTIKVGSVSLNNINLRTWRDNCGSVLQDGYLFEDSIARNIVLTDEEIDTERLANAIKMACLEDYIDSLPMGVNTELGHGGNGVSQGQRQRLLIARALYKNPYNLPDKPF